MTTFIFISPTDTRTVAEVMAAYPGRRAIGRMINGQPVLVLR